MSGQTYQREPKERDRAAVRFPPPLVFLLAIAAGALADRLFPTFALPDLGGATRIASPIFGVAGLLLAGGALRLFFRTGQNPEPWTPSPSLVTSGVYRVTRNPMYLGMAFIHASIALFLRDGWLLVMLPIAMFAVYRIAIAPEEAYLGAKFGPAYEDYRRQVRRWL